VTKRKIGEFWTEVKRIIRGEVRQSTCCCAAPGATPKGCAIAGRLTTRCRCACHLDALAEKVRRA
jgi:hypothetical protein